MNFSTLIGFAIAISIFVWAITMDSSSVGTFLNLHAFLIVIGGTGAASLICFSLPKILGLLRVFALRVIGARKRDYVALVQQISLLAQARSRGVQPFEAAIKSIQDPFLKDAAEVLFWAESDVPTDQLRDLLETRAITHFEQYMDEANTFRTIAKFPPAFGLLGTTIGMIMLLGSLGSEDARSSIGPSMAVALVATLYGIGAANLLLIPIAESLTKQTKEDLVARRMVVAGILALHEGLPAKFVEEKVKSFLLPNQRSKIPQRSGSAGGRSTPGRGPGQTDDSNSRKVA